MDFTYIFSHHLPPTVLITMTSNVVSQYSFAYHRNSSENPEALPLTSSTPKGQQIWGKKQDKLTSKLAEVFNKVDYTTFKHAGNLPVVAWPEIKLNNLFLICKPLVCFY